MNNAAYHADLTHLSSSSLKLLLKDPRQFHHDYILGLREDVDKPAFAEGKYTHTLVLEPDKLHEYAIWNGLRRAGNAYKEFVAANLGKTILSAVQERHGQMYKAALDRRPEAVAMLTGGAPEFTILGSFLQTPVKMRADYINSEAGYIVDLKTTALPSGKENFAFAVEEYGYDLSAALYCKIAEDFFGKPFEFYWHVISKCDLDCQVYKMSAKTHAAGSGKVVEALLLYKRCKETGIWAAQQPRPSFDTDNYEIEEI